MIHTHKKPIPKQRQTKQHSKKRTTTKKHVRLTTTAKTARRAIHHATPAQPTQHTSPTRGSDSRHQSSQIFARTTHHHDHISSVRHAITKPIAFTSATSTNIHAPHQSRQYTPSPIKQRLTRQHNVASPATITTPVMSSAPLLFPRIPTSHMLRTPRATFSTTTSMFRLFHLVQTQRQQKRTKYIISLSASVSALVVTQSRL